MYGIFGIPATGIEAGDEKQRRTLSNADIEGT
jgi:hypothetical protein